MNAEAPVAGKRVRDPRLDFFRGIGMFIIFLAHTPGDPWTLWIPARFGFSDATEIFVFCSGMASAIAFGAIFSHRGWLMGTARILFRVWQVYWAHIALFFVIAGMMVAFDELLDWRKSYVGSLNLFPFFKNTQENLVGLLTLTYVPNYFDILPMYLVILALIPIIMAARRAHAALPFCVVILLWLCANLGYLSLPAEPWSKRQWFFNPFGWQLVFFTGFALMCGWIKPPPVTRSLIILATAIVLITIPFAWYKIYRVYPELLSIRNGLKEEQFIAKTPFGILRYVHFLSLAYLSWVAVGEGGRRLIAEGIWGHFVRIVQKVGQQSLAVFVSSLVFAQICGAIMREFGKQTILVTMVNLGGFAALIAVAYSVAWFKSTPWKRPLAPSTAIGQWE